MGKPYDWRKPVEVDTLESEDQQQFAELLADALTGNSGVGRMPYRGQDALWAYSGVVEGGGEGFPVLIVPYETIMAPAAAAEKQVLAWIGMVLRVTGLGLAVVVVVIVVLAALASRTVTRPIRMLTDAAEALAGGNFDARVAIYGSDEIGELSKIFNDTGPKLKEREKLKHSLELAKEVQRSEERFRGIAESMSDWIWEIDANLVCTYCSAKVESVLGFRQDEIIGNTPFDFMPSEEAERVRRTFGEIFKNRQSFRDVENWNLTKDGRRICLLTSGVPILGDDGEFLGYRGVNSDVTVRKHADQALRQAKDAALEAQRASESANQAKSGFLANMSHELRTPLNSILGYSQILQRDKSLTKQQRDAVDTIHYSSEHLLTLINELLDLTRIEAQKMELAPAAMYLPGFFKRITEIARIRAEQKGVPFDCEIASELPTGVRADEQRLRQVLLNLISNAIKFAGQGSVVLRVSVKSPTAHDAGSPTARIHCEVEDTGIGISPEEMEDIFLPFHQVHKTQLTTEGTGLGLPISRNLVRLMGGELQVTSIKGEGTTFSFDLELPEVRGVTATDVADAARPSQGIVGVKGDKRRLLLVDDNDDNRATLRAMLSPLGFEIGEAADSEEAITEATAFHPELILMDLVMPVMDGLEATRRIRQISALEGVSVIGVSASLLGGERQRSLEAGCDDFLAKPINMDELLACLQRHLRLEWLYEKPSSGPPAGQHETRPLVVPSREDLEALLEFAEISHVTGLQQSLESLKKVDEKFTPFATAIEELIESFQFEEVIKMIESYLQGQEE